MKRRKPAKPYWEMNLQELQEATKQFDKPLPLSRTRPLTKAERDRFERARRGGVHSIYVSRRRPGKSAAGRRTMVVDLDSHLLKSVDRCALKQGLSRAELVERSLRSALVLVGQA